MIRPNRIYGVGSTLVTWRLSITHFYISCCLYHSPDEEEEYFSDRILREPTEVSLRQWILTIKFGEGPARY